MQSMPSEHAIRILNECKDLGFRGPVYFYLFSEPFLDPRLIEMAHLARQLGMLPRVNTNGDVLRANPTLRKEAISVFDAITIGLYNEDTVAKYSAAVSEWRSMMGDKIGFSPLNIMGARPGNGIGGTPDRSAETCRRLSQRLIITYNGRSAICCYDMKAEFDLPNAFENSVKDVWWSDERLRIASELRKKGGRVQFPLCKACCMPASASNPGLGWENATKLAK